VPPRKLARLVTAPDVPPAAHVPALPPDIVRIPLPIPFAIGPINAYLLLGDPLTLIDPGPRIAETEAALERGVRDAGHELADIELVVLTHQHHDHVGLAAEVRRRSGARVAAIEPLARYMGEIEDAMERDDVYAGAVMARHGVGAEVVGTLQGMSRTMRRFSEGVSVEVVLGEGESVRLGGRDFEIHRRPGHSPTDTVLLEQRSGLLVGGDHLMEHVSSNPIAHYPTGDTRDPVEAASSRAWPGALCGYLDSMRQTAAMEVALVLPGHGEPFADHRGLVDRRIAHHERRARKILGEVNGERTGANIAELLWRRLPISHTYLALSEVLGHLELLERRGEVELGVEDGPARARAVPRVS
jgi:glyoxylase-like metal-dependent hydrolase (beta-lactamase superfamily II)